jgi:GrpB-like predicted nucleotidyltransferase (UPF0157 family)
MSRYVFKPYQPIFPELFKKEKERLRELVGEEVVIEHFGSTAVPELGGKGIIDIAVAVSLDQLEEMSKKVQQAGYLLQPGEGTDQRIVHILDLTDPLEGERRYHLHVTDLESDDYKNSILLRDYLKTHSEEREAYAKIKEEAVNLGKDNKAAYMAHKGPMILEILRRAKSEID